MQQGNHLIGMEGGEEPSAQQTDPVWQGPEVPEETVSALLWGGFGIAGGMCLCWGQYVPSKPLPVSQ